LPESKWGERVIEVVAFGASLTLDNIIKHFTLRYQNHDFSFELESGICLHCPRK
jgi:hypothetical protein